MRFYDVWGLKISKALFNVMTFFVTAVCFAGPPGGDGGGGDVVLTPAGQLRFLDMAIFDGIPLKNFSDHDFASIFIGRMPWASTHGKIVKSDDFFACANSKFSHSENRYLRILVGGFGFRLRTLMTDLPISLIADGRAELNFKDFSGERENAQLLPLYNLLSPSLPGSVQRPVASFFRGELPGQALVDWDILIVSQRLYSKLSPTDQCAVQIHERLRYLNSEGQKQGWALLKRPLSTQEIERITAQIMHGQAVAEDDVPATPFFEAIAKFGLDKIDSGVSPGLDDLEIANQKYAGMTLVQSASLCAISNKMQEGVEAAREGVNILRDEQSTGSPSILFHQILGNLPASYIDLNSVLPKER